MSPGIGGSAGASRGRCRSIRAGALALLLGWSACTSGRVRLPPPVQPPAPPGPAVQQVLPPVEPDVPVRATDRRRIEEDLGLTQGMLDREGREIRLIPGDGLEVVVVGYPELSGDVPVLPDGRIAVVERRADGSGYRRAIPAEGRTPAELEAAVAEALRSDGVQHHGVQIALKTQAARSVTLVATEPRTGAVPIAASGTLLETLSAAGWNLRRSRAKQVALFRGGRSTVIDMRQIVDRCDVSVNVPLENNDVLVLLESEPVNVQGAVRQPGSFPLPLPGRLDVRYALLLAGGIQENADVAGVRLVRANGEVLSVDLNRILFGGVGESVLMEPGDTLIVPAARQLPVYVFGMVSEPGLKNLPAGSRLTHALAVAQPLQFGARISHVVVVRHYFSGGEPEVYHVNVDQLMLSPDSRQDVALEAGDVVYVPETLSSDVIDGMTRALAPLVSGATTTSTLYLQSLRAAGLQLDLQNKKDNPP